MKRVIVLAVTASLGFALTGCSSTPTASDIAEQENDRLVVQQEFQQKQDEIKESKMQDSLSKMPDWYLNPPRADQSGFYGAGQGESEDLTTAVRKAQLQAKFQLASFLKSELSGEETANGSSDSNFRYIANNFVNSVDLSGAEYVKKVVGVNLAKYQVYVLAKYSVNNLADKIASIKNQSDRAGLEDAYKRLMKRVKVSKATKSSPEELPGSSGTVALKQ